VCVAHGSADLLDWDPASEPLIAEPPPEITGGYHRDPFVFGEPGAWRMLIGSGLFGDSGRSGAVLHYASTDAAEWAYRGVLLQRPAGAGPIDTGPMWECPQVFRSDGQDVLVISVQMEDEPDPLRKCVYAVGTLGDTSFELRSLDRVDYGNVFYAPAITWDDDGRVLMWGWVQEKHGRLDVDHSGALSLPRVVDLHHGRLRVAPAPELVGLRGVSVDLGAMADADSAALDVIPGLADSFEVEARVPVGQRAELSLCAADRIVYRLIVDDALGMAVVESGSFGPFEAPLPPRAADYRSIRLYVDGSLMELFLDDEVALTTRCYEEPPTRLTAHGAGAVVLSDVVVHGLDAAMPARPA
jgi:beta-fructofuranosidase